MTTPAAVFCFATLSIAAVDSAARLDKWLWFARVVKQRPTAAELVEAGHVRPGHRVARVRCSETSKIIRPV